MRLNKDSIKNLSKADQIAVRKVLKTDKKELKKDLKRLLFEVCILRDGEKCLRCGKKTTLQTSHIHPKGEYKKMEFEIDNVKILCLACHIYWWHKNPIEAQEWLERTIDPERLAKLKLMTQTIMRKPLDYKMIKIYLGQLKKEYEKERCN